MKEILHISFAIFNLSSSILAEISPRARFIYRHHSAIALYYLRHYRYIIYNVITSILNAICTQNYLTLKNYRYKYISFVQFTGEISPRAHFIYRHHSAIALYYLHYRYIIYNVITSILNAICTRNYLTLKNYRYKYIYIYIIRPIHG